MAHIPNSRNTVALTFGIMTPTVSLSLLIFVIRRPSARLFFRIVPIRNRLRFDVFEHHAIRSMQADGFEQRIEQRFARSRFERGPLHDPAHPFRGLAPAYLCSASLRHRNGDWRVDCHPHFGEVQQREITGHPAEW